MSPMNAGHSGAAAGARLFQAPALAIAVALVAGLSACQGPPAEPGAKPAAATSPNTRLAGVSRLDPEVAPGRVLVKLAPAGAAGQASALASDTSDEAVLVRIRRVAGVKATRQTFPKARAPVAARMLQSPSGATVAEPDLTRWHRVDLESGVDASAKLAELKALPGVAVAELDYLRRPTIPLPNNGSDPLLGQQWHLDAVHAREAWTYLDGLGLPPGGSRDVVVAVIDTGIDLTHPDLAANLWTNPADGTHGLDTITGSKVPMDDHGHGTHVAGIIAAQADNRIGGVGIAYNVQLMAIKAAQYSGVLAASDIAEGIYFAVANGADIINMSFGGYGESQIEQDALTVAFGTAVLVAAAGNDGAPNCISPMYPAAYNWVLGVMASMPSAGSFGDLLAGFSNTDCAPGDYVEYELMAPGVGIQSTLPQDNFAAWSGTSMAAPVVSGIAALVRTRFPDKNIYDSRFVMGQVSATGAVAQAHTFEDGKVVSAHMADAYAALTSLPIPSLAYLRMWLFDTQAIDQANNGNGRVNAGETIELAVEVKNRWGKADNVQVRLVPWAAGAFQADPYVTMLVDTVPYGAVGSFATDDNGLLKDAGGAITGVAHPFRFSVRPDTPNQHVIPFKVQITATNGLDPSDSTTYSSESTFSLIVTNGRELPRIISSDMVLTKDTLWIVPDATLVDVGATLTVTEGTELQFYASDPLSPYLNAGNPYIQVRGHLNMVGTAAEPVRLSIAGYARERFINLSRSGAGRIDLKYVKVEGFHPRISVDTMDHCEWVGYGNTGPYGVGESIFAGAISSSRLEALGNSMFATVSVDSLSESLVTRSIVDVLWPSVTNSVLLTNSRFCPDCFGGIWYPSSFTMHSPCGAPNTQIVRNAFLEPVADPNRPLSVFWGAFGDAWSGLQGCNTNLDGNYWGGVSNRLIDAMVRDFNDDFNMGRLDYLPVLSTPPDTAYPFVVGVELTDAGGIPGTVFGPGSVGVRVVFNRDMDVGVQPSVGFGPAIPFTDHAVPGGWTDSRTWTGNFLISPLSGDGYQYIRVAGARAVDDPWLVTGEDVGRFRFEVITSGTESMNLQASGSEGRIDLTWTQTDFDLLAGYNVYRSTSATGTFTRNNTAIIPPQTKAYTDTAVAPGQPYYYRFTVVKTDMTESTFSNVATATPLDTIPPVISHAPATSAPVGLALSLSAQVTDNVSVQSVDLYARSIGAPTYTRRSMTKTTGNTWVATIEGSSMTSPGVEYYLSATDGITTVTSGRPEYPYQVVVVDRPVLTTVTPSRGPATGGTLVTISGSNFKQGASVTFSGAAADGVTVVSSTQITCTTPVSFPDAADVSVRNLDGQAGTLLRAFTFESDVASLSLASVEAGSHAVTQLPIRAGNVAGLVALDLVVAFDASVVGVRRVTTGTLTPGWSIAANTSASGQVRLSMASPGGAVSGDGVLANLEIELLGTPGASTPVTITAALLNGGAIPVATAPGLVTVQAVCSVAGSVRAWSGGTAIPGVQLQLSGERLYVAQTDLSGGFQVPGAAPGAYTLRPSKTGDVGGITAYDASLVLQHAAGLIALAGEQAVAADVNKSGGIDSMDAFHVLRAAAGLVVPPFPGAGVEWEFSPATRSYASLSGDVTGQDFTGILLGDVSGNWSSSILQGGPAATLRVQEWPPTAAPTIAAVVTATPSGQSIFSFDLVLTYDPSRGTPTAVVVDTATQGWLISANTSRPGEIRVSLAGATPLVMEGPILALAFDAAAGAQDVALHVQSASLNETTQADVQYWLTMEHAWLAAGMALGIQAPTASQLTKLDLGPIQGGTGTPNAVIDVEDVVLALRNATGLTP